MSSGCSAVLQTAFGAIVASAIGGVVALVVASRQRKEQRLLRQNKWADELREHILEVISPATWFYLAKWKSRPSPQGDGTLWDTERENYTIKLTDGISRVCLMLDPENDTHAELMKALKAVRTAAFTRDTQDVGQFDNAIQLLIKSGWAVVSQVSSETAFRSGEGRLRQSAQRMGAKSRRRQERRADPRG